MKNKKSFNKNIARGISLLLCAVFLLLLNKNVFAQQNINFEISTEKKGLLGSVVFTSDQDFNAIWDGNLNSLGKFIFDRDIEIDTKSLITESNNLIVGAGKSENNEISIVLAYPMIVQKRVISGNRVYFDLISTDRPSNIGYTLGFRASPHPAFDRIVLDFFGVPQYDIDSESIKDTLIVRAPYAISPYGVEQVELLPSVESVSWQDQDTVLIIKLKTGAKSSYYRYKDSLVVELFGSQSVAVSKPLGNVVPPESVNRVERADGNIDVEMGKHPDYVRLKFDWPQAVNYLISHKAGLLDIVFFTPAEFNMPNVDSLKIAGISNIRQQNTPERSQVTLNVDQRIPVRHFSNGTALVIDILLSDINPLDKRDMEEGAFLEGQEFSPPFEVSGRTGNEAVAEKNIAIRELPNNIINTSTGNSSSFAARLEFNWAHAIGAAVFKREQFVWIIFDNISQVDVAKIKRQTQGVVTDVKLLPSNKATVLRLTLSDDYYPRVFQNGFTWIVTLHKDFQQTRNPLPIEVLPLGTGLSITAPVGRPGKTFKIIDPFVKDIILIGTLPSEGYGAERSRTYPGFELLESLQGIAIFTRDESIEIGIQDLRYIVSRPDGLPITHQVGVQQFENPILPFGRWHQPNVKSENIFSVAFAPYIDTKIRLDSGRVTDPKERENLSTKLINLRHTAIGDIIGYYLSDGLYVEAGAADEYLQIFDLRYSYETGDSDALLHAAVATMRNNLQKAQQWLDDDKIKDFSETKLWKAVVAAKKSQWQEANNYFDEAATVLSTYPNMLYIDLTLLRLRSLLELELLAESDVLINLLSSRNLIERQSRELNLLTARRNLLVGNLSAALGMFNDLATQKDTVGVFAKRFALLNQEIDETGTAEELEKLLLSSRGVEEIEFAILVDLAKIYGKLQDHERSFLKYREAISYFPDNEKTLLLREDLIIAFKDLFFKDEFKNIPAERLYKIYREYQELTPSDNTRDVLIENLADRLFVSNNFAATIELLDSQVEFSLEGREKIRTALKLILTRIARGEQQNPEPLIEFIDGLSLRSLSIDDALRHDANLIKAFLSMKKNAGTDSKRIIAGDVNLLADLLRRDIAIENQDWEALALVQERLTGDPPTDVEEKLNISQARNLISWAVALYRLEDVNSLAQLDRIYGPHVPDGDINVLFKLLASDNQPASTESVQIIVDLINKLDSVAPSVSFIDRMLRKYFPEKDATL